MDDFDNRQRLRVCWDLDSCKTSDLPAYELVAARLYEEMQNFTAGLPKAGAYLARLLDHIKVIVCNLHCASVMPDMSIAFHRAGSAYKNDPAYRGFQFSSANVCRVTDFLKAYGFIVVVEGYPGSAEYEAQLSKMWATPKLLDLLNAFGADPETVYRDTSRMESVIVKGKKVRPARKKGQPRPAAKRRIIKTPDKPIVRQMRANLETINAVIRQSRIDLDVDLYELNEINRRLSADPDKYKRPVDFTNKSLYRVFLDGSLEKHGRFYGGWWEGISEEDREKIIINGRPTVELDYKAIHPYILYGLEDTELPAADAYYLAGQDEQTNRTLRPLIKRFLLIMFNASSEADAIRALADAYRKAKAKATRRGEPYEPPPFKISAANMRPIIEQLRAQHEPIAHYFFKDCGNMLMYHDSQMAEEVLLHFAHKGVACLPVHDSFIVDIRYADECWEVMREAYRRRFGQQIPVDVLSFSERAKKVLAGSRAVAMSKSWMDEAGWLTGQIKGGDPSDEWTGD